MKQELYFSWAFLFAVSSFVTYHSPKNCASQSLSLHSRQAAPFFADKFLQAGKKSVASSTRFFIEEREYTIKNTAGIYTSTNRKQNIRTVYEADGFQVSSRKENSGNWKLNLKLAGINKGGKNLASLNNPDFETINNTLRVAHRGYTIEYSNDKNGTRQNFLVQKKPAGTEPLKVLLQPCGNIALKNVTNNSAAFGDASGTKLFYGDLHVWDAKGNVLPAKMKKEGSLLALVVEDDKAVYPVTVDPLASTPEKTLGGQQADDQTGYSVASAGDINNDGFDDLIVGAITYDNGQTDEGAAFIYYGSATGPAAVPDVILESNSANLRFGYSLAAADFNKDGYSDVVIGVPQYTNGVGEAYEGALYIYYGSATGPASSPIILEGNKGGARMGTCVAVGDLNGDGLTDIASGALGYNNAGALYNGQGGVYVFYGTAGGLNTTPSILTPGLQGGVAFGGSTTGVSIGNFNGDGYDDLVVGAEGYDEGVSNQGAVFLYFGAASGVPSTYSKLFASNQASAALGSSVAFAGDLNKDGLDDVAAGSPYYTGSQTREGAVFIYYGSATATINTQTVGSNMTDAYMGYTVAGGGDLDGDGFDDLAVGAYNYAFDPADLRGGVFVFGGSPSGLTTAPVLSKQENAANMNGFSMAFVKKIDGTHGLHLAVGQPGYSGGVAEDGAVDLYAADAGALPVTLNQFGAKLLSNGEVEITWDTYSEQRNAHYEVLRSTDGTQFTLLGRRDGQLNSTSHITYQLIDKSPKEGSNFYRLVQYDVDGKARTIGIRMVKVGFRDLPITLSPNPTTGLITIGLGSGNYTKADLVDLTGKTINTQKPQRGDFLRFNLSGLTKGMYLIRLYTADGTIVSKQVVKN